MTAVGHDVPPYRVQVEYIAQEVVPGGWHDVASTDDLDNVAEMLAGARRRWEVSWETGRRGPVEIRLVRRVTTWQTYPEPEATGGSTPNPTDATATNANEGPS